jgi:hypothetical protein
VIRQQWQQNQGCCGKYEAITQLGRREDVDGEFVQGTSACEQQRDDDRPAGGNRRMFHCHDPEKVSDEERKFGRDTGVSGSIAPVRDRHEGRNEHSAHHDEDRLRERLGARAGQGRESKRANPGRRALRSLCLVPARCRSGVHRPAPQRIPTKYSQQQSRRATHFDRNGGESAQQSAAARERPPVVEQRLRRSPHCDRSEDEQSLTDQRRIRE